MDYYVLPKGDKPLLSLLLETDSPGAKAMKSMGARFHIYAGMPGFLLGDIFYTAAPDALNVLYVMDSDEKFLIELPITKISIPRAGEMVFYDEDSNVTIGVSNKPAFHLFVGSTIQITTNGHKPSPWH